MSNETKRIKIWSDVLGPNSREPSSVLLPFKKSKFMRKINHKQNQQGESRENELEGESINQAIGKGRP